VESGFYSVVQFCPDPLREEGVNVGLIAGGKGPELYFRADTAFQQVKRVFGAKSFDEARLASSLRALEKRLNAHPVQNEEQLRAFISRESGQLRIVPPRAANLRDLRIDAAALFASVVGAAIRKRKERVKAPNLDAHFYPLEANPAVQKDVPVEIPILGKTLRADYSYKNGALNFVKGQGFPADATSAAEQAMRIGSQGLMLAKHPVAGSSRKLIVVGEFADGENAETVEAILIDHSVRMVPLTKIDEFVKEIEQVAHV